MGSAAKRIARLGLMTALGAVLLLLTGRLPTGKLWLMILASFPVCVSLMMYGPIHAAGVFVLTAVLAFLLVPGTTAVGYVVFFGYYPIAKSLFERTRGAIWHWVLKAVLYAAAFTVSWFFAQTLFSGGAGLPWYALFLLGAAAFVVYDWCYSLVIRLYLVKAARYFQ